MLSSFMQSELREQLLCAVEGRSFGILKLKVGTGVEESRVGRFEEGA